MNITDDVKRLIGDGKTQQAIDMLQEIVEGRDTDLLNQTLLLESQFKDLQRKMQLGLEDANAEINRIKNTLLILCDDVEKMNLEGNRTYGKTQTEKNPSLTNALVIFGIVVALAIGVIGYLVFREDAAKSETPKTDTPTRPINTEKVETGNSSTNNPSTKATWVTKPTFAYLRYRVYGDFQIDILDIYSQPIDAENKTIKIKLKLTCTVSSSGTCMANYLEYRFEKPNKDKFAPSNRPEYKPEILVKDGTFAKTLVEFDMPSDVNNGVLFIHYTGLPDVPLVKINLKEQ